MKYFGTVLLACFFFWGGCSDAVSPTAPGLVQEIEITCPQESVVSRRFADQDNMRAILNYLRCTQFHDRQQPDEAPAGQRRYTITLYHSDGRVTVYDQLDDLWLCRRGGRWHQLDPIQGQKLPRLYQSLP